MRLAPPSPRRFEWGLAIAFLLLSSGAAEVEASDPVRIDREVQLLVDSHWVDQSHNVTRRLGSVTKVNGGGPIFTDGWFYGTVLHDAGRFKLWFRKPGTQGFGYAESLDGLSFEKVADVTGIPFAGDYTLAVEIDSSATEPARRYLGGFDAQGMAAGLAFSEDGIHWRAANEGRPVTGRAADSYNQFLWDPNARAHRLFTRTDFGTAGGAGEIRGTRSMANSRLNESVTDWHVVSEWKFDREGNREAGRRQVYAVTGWIWRGIYFALLSVYEYPGDLSEGKETDLVRRHERDVMNFYIATSRDAEHWDFHWVYASQPIIPRGQDGTFDKDLLSRGDEHWLYYAGANERHGTPETSFQRTSAIGLAKIRRDRLAGWGANETPGEIVTRPFQWPVGNLRLNVEAPNGSFDVSVLNEAGEAIPGLAARGKTLDRLECVPDWDDPGQLATITGQTVRLKITLQNAVWYAFEVR
ncbi:MAG: hypothetical protein NT069_21800 [Planctomycetota bacterium]|nr:hypothetical protein [Planctomycetota bacterium]